MDHNEISMFMDAKLDFQDKRPETVTFREWMRCQVRIEAVKCLPCFLRITLEPRQDINSPSLPAEEHKPANFTISINVPGVAITLASSRTKQHSYAVSWVQNRRNCYIYFALETELSCRRHMKWIRKSIKNLELHRKIMLEDRRTSRGVTDVPALGPLPLLPADFDESSHTWSQRVSEIYEEIFDGNQADRKDSQRLSRRCSRTSIASGIYEEMKAPFNTSSNFECINEEMFSIPSTPPPLPPLPPQRKRFNTYEAEETAETLLSDAIPRSNTNPETEMAKKKKYKNVLENLFHGGGLRSKRTVSASEGSKEQITEEAAATADTARQLVKSESTEREIFPAVFISPPASNVSPIYANDDAFAAKRQKKPCRIEEAFEKHRSKRNSFSSPDLSKINFVDTFDEQRIADILGNSYSKCEELDFVNGASLNETDLLLTKAPIKAASKPTGNNSNEDYNISQKIPHNFNFSACNTSAINLIAPLSTQVNKQAQKNRIIFDDLSGYCVMAPIVKKMSAIDNTPLPNKFACAVQPLESTSSGYSTGSYSSSTSSCTNSAEEHNALKPDEQHPSAIQEESVVYENMQDGYDGVAEELPKTDATVQKFAAEFTGNLYENLLAVKAAQELEQIPIKNSSKISTSTPTDSPLLEAVTPDGTATKATSLEEENYYQTPRKSIISIDEKVPSYYPNTCESSVKSRRRSYSPTKVNNKGITEQRTPTTVNEEQRSGSATTTPVIRHFMNAKMRHERKENIYLTSPQGLIEQRRKSKTDALISPKKYINSKTSKNKKTAAHKISENVYAVTHCLKKSIGPQTNCNNNIETKPLSGVQDIEVKEHKLQSELLQLAILQNIDFKFEDPDLNKAAYLDNEMKTTTPTTPIRAVSSPIKEDSSRKALINSAAHSPAPKTHMSQSTITNSENVEVVDNQLTAGIKKFASLPRFKKFNLSPLRTRINNVLQRNHTPDL